LLTLTLKIKKMSEFNKGTLAFTTYTHYQYQMATSTLTDSFLQAALDLRKSTTDSQSIRLIRTSEMSGMLIKLPYFQSCHFVF
jgi:hypothetical protein